MTTTMEHSAPEAVHDEHGHGEHGHGDAGHHHVNYFAVFCALCVFTGLSVIFDVFDMFSKPVLVAAVLAVACAKAMCVMAFFMHLKFEGNWKYIILAPTTILAIGLMVALAPDNALHYYTPDVPQMKTNLTAEDFQKQHDMNLQEGPEHQPAPSVGIPATIQ